ncbi:hypothetical protein BSG1_16110 [Bacillus sp. SG-1]|nr:hypothetical protein BSG1_16110 [Bacillus sp. SG-1]
MKEIWQHTDLNQLGRRNGTSVLKKPHQKTILIIAKSLKALYNESIQR